jgi:hypothetical protein
MSGSVEARPDDVVGAGSAGEQAVVTDAVEALEIDSRRQKT